MTVSPRIATGIPLVIAGVVIPFLPHALFSACVGLVILLGAREWARLCGLTRPVQSRGYVALVAILCASAWAWLATLAVPIAALGCAFWLLACALVAGAQRGRFDLGRGRGLRLLGGLVILVPAWSSMAYLQTGQAGSFQVLFLMALVWSADITAFFFGRAFGRTKLCPAVSPGKSVEGAVAGVTAALLLGIAVAISQNLPASSMVRFTLLVVVTATISIVGDLFESMLKRSANVKDSGTLLPGHGGVLDRIDSLTAAAPVYLLGLELGAGLP